MKGLWKFEQKGISTKKFVEVLVSNYKLSNQELELEEVYDHLLQAIGINTQNNTDENIYLAVLKFFDENPTYAVQAILQDKVKRFSVTLKRAQSYGKPEFELSSSNTGKKLGEQEGVFHNINIIIVRPPGVYFA